MSPPAVPRLRKSRPKTRTGCKTCKTRRVKCDEAKPHCARCLTFGVDCEGYEFGRKPKAAAEIQLKNIAPQPCHSQAFVLSTLGKHTFTAVFGDNREYSYFLYFQEEASLDISSHFDQSLFNHVIIPSSWSEPSLCQLVASLGALYKAIIPKSSDLRAEDSHRQYAFQKYGRALKAVQAKISAHQFRDTTRISLIASLLIYCFESLCGDTEMALRHLESAMVLMRTQLVRTRRRYAHSKNLSPDPNLDDDLVAAFFRLDSGLSSRYDIFESETTGSRLGTHNLADMWEIPERFYTISEARNYLESIQFPAVPSLGRDFLKLYQPPSSRFIDEHTRDLYATLISQMYQWNLAFAPLYDETFTPTGEKNSMAAATLRVRALSLVIDVKRICAKETILPSFHDLEGREIVDLSKLVSADPGFLKSFVWDCGIVPGLFIVVAACTDVVVRKDALQLLKDIVPRREGAWDSSICVGFGEQCLRMSGDT